jgi:hypothetical protein
MRVKQEESNSMDDFNQHQNIPSSYTEDDEDLPPELQLIAQRYSTQPVPHPTPEDTARLLTRLLTEETVVMLNAVHERGFILRTLRVARWRIRLLGPWFWIAGVLLLIFGALLAPVMNRSNAIMALILLVPLTAVLGLAHALRTTSPGLREIEASCPTSYVEVSAGLVLAIVGFDCLLGILATVLLALVQWAPFGALLAAWIGPLLLIVGVSLLVALRWGAIPAAIVGGGPWLLLALAAFLNPTGALALVFTLPLDLLSLTLHLVAAVLGGLILILLLRGSSWAHVRSLYKLNGGTL